MIPRLTLCLLLLPVVACGPKQAARSTVRPVGMTANASEELPAWRTEDGRLGAWRELAHWYIDNNRPDEALEMVQRLRDAGERTRELDLIQARALAAQGVPEEARRLLEGIVQKEQRNAQVWHTLGLVYADLQEVDLAIQAFRRAIALNPRDAATLNNLGFLEMVSGQCEEAVKHLEAATEADATSARFRNNLAFSLVCTGEEERALKLFRSTSGSEADARFNLGLALERLDRIAGAVLQYRKALDVDPGHGAASEALTRLAQLNPIVGEGP